MNQKNNNTLMSDDIDVVYFLTEIDNATKYERTYI